MRSHEKRGGKATILESIPALVLMGILAGGVGGLAIGIVTGSHSSGSAPSSAQPAQK